MEIRSGLALAGKGKGDRNAQDGTESGIGYTHVTRGRIEQTLPVPKIAVRQRGPQDIQRGTVLDRAAWIEPFRLGEDPDPRRQILSHPAKREKRGVAHMGSQIAD